MCVCVYVCGLGLGTGGCGWWVEVCLLWCGLKCIVIFGGFGGVYIFDV